VIDAGALRDAPQAVRLLGENYVLWRDGQGTARAAPDRCPHRGTQLSLGRVVGGELQCPYHGWRFDGAGRCTAIPSLPGFVPGNAQRLASVALREAHGLLWLAPAAPEAVPPAFDPDSALRGLTAGPYDVATSAPRIVENFLDMAHFAFVHAGWLGDAARAEVPPYAVSVDAQGVHARGCRAFQPRSNLASTEASGVDYDYDVPAPYIAVLRKAPDAQAGWREAIALFVSPVEPEASRVWFRLAMPPTQGDDAAIRAFQDTIFQQDRPVLESQRPRRLPLDGEVHCAADRTAAAYRRWLRDCGVTFGVC
jgi:phenylpropionate dioxygenase-like ring-hydroxylating dioxygenase large terminal subunit